MSFARKAAWPDPEPEPEGPPPHAARCLKHECWYRAPGCPWCYAEMMGGSLPRHPDNAKYSTPVHKPPKVSDRLRPKYEAAMRLRGEGKLSDYRIARILGIAETTLHGWTEK